MTTAVPCHFLGPWIAVDPISESMGGISRDYNISTCLLNLPRGSFKDCCPKQFEKKKLEKCAFCKTLIRLGGTHTYFKANMVPFSAHAYLPYAELAFILEYNIFKPLVGE